jgi:hypothetical protein
MVRPVRPIFDFNGIEYEMNERAVRVALVRCQVAGRYRRKSELADEIGCSRSTVSRFFAGRQTSLRTVMDILDRLNVTFEEVFTPVNLDGH